MCASSISHTDPTFAAPKTSVAAQLILGGVLCAIVLGLTTNLSTPWESDQPAKAAQILEVANRHNYWLGSEVPRCYRLSNFPFYYSASGLLYTITGGDIFAFMNLSSAVLGVIAAVSIAWALYNTLRIAPIWTILVFLCMPLFVTNFFYGNEAAWSMAFFILSLALLTSPRRSLHYAAGAAVAMGLFSRPDIVWLAPYWLAWTVLFCKSPSKESWIIRTVRPAAAFVITAFALWLLLLRRIPETEGAFEFAFNLKLIAAYMSYPFNPSIVLLGAIGWLMLLKDRRSYALAHLLLLLPIAFYLRNLSSPKYIICMLLFYGLPAAYLFERATNWVRATMAATVAVWFFVGVSIYGIFGPTGSSLWYVPTADGPCPIGGYVGFYARARAGEYQLKQVEHIDQARDFVQFAKNSDGKYWIAGHWLVQPIHLLRAWGEIGDANAQARVDEIIKAPGSRNLEQPNDGSRILMMRSGYLDLSTLNDELEKRVRTWLEKGQFQPVGPGAAQFLPTIIEVGDHIPEGKSSMLGRRLLFAIDLYEGHMVFKQSEFIPAYRATSWAPAGTKADAEPVYSDEQVAVFDRPVENAEIVSYAWPARYYQLKSPIPKYRARLAK